MNNQQEATYQKQVAVEIIRQIEAGYNMKVNGQKVSTMKLLGAHHAVYGDNGVMFFVKAKGKKFNKVIVILNEKDLYNVEFWIVKTGANFRCKLIKNFEDIYNDRLGSLIVEETIF